MKCPRCGKEITMVNVISYCWQKGYLKGNKIVDYGSIEEILDRSKLECPECFTDISVYIEE